MTGSANGIVLVQSNTANASAVSITTGGDITGLGGSASRVPASPYGTQLQNTLGDGNRAGYGVLALNAGSGTLTVTTSGGTVQAAQSDNAIDARNAGGLITIKNADALQHAASVTGGSGINAINSGAGGVSVTNSGTIGANGGAFTNGVVAYTTNAAGAVTVDNQAGGDIKVAGTGIIAFNQAGNPGAVTVSNAASITAGTGISASGSGAGHRHGQPHSRHDPGDEQRHRRDLVRRGRRHGEPVRGRDPHHRDGVGRRRDQRRAAQQCGRPHGHRRRVHVRCRGRAGDQLRVGRHHGRDDGEHYGRSRGRQCPAHRGSGNVVVTTATKTTLTSNAGNGVLGASHGASGTGYVQIDNAATLTHTSGTGGTAIYASNGTSGSLNSVQTAVSVGNSGTITDKLSTGIDARGGSIGVVSVANSGSITVAGTGISLSGSGGGSVVNSGTVGGANGLSVGGGSFALSNTGTIAGTTAAIQIASGTLTVKALGTINGAIVDNGQLTLNQAGSYTLASAVSGSGALTVQNVGAGNTATLSGALTQRGGFTVTDASNVTVAKGASFYGVKLNGGIFTNLGSADTRAVTNGPRTTPTPFRPTGVEPSRTARPTRPARRSRAAAPASARSGPVRPSSTITVSSSAAITPVSVRSAVTARSRSTT